MSISSASIPVGATYTPAGGAATSFVSLGQSPGANDAFLDDGKSLILRILAKFTSKAPVVSSGAPNGYTQQRSSVVLKYPKLLANGNYTINTVRLEASYDPETTDAERDFLWEAAAHICVDADFANFREDGSTE